MHYDKQPKGIDGQIDLLKGRGLAIADEDVARHQLCNVSYFRLASYLRCMEADAVAHHYKAGSSFDAVIALYAFDRDLRQLVFTALHDVEISLRTKVIQTFSSRYGAFWFMDASLFRAQSVFENCLENIRKEVSRSNEEFIKEHFLKYDTPELPPVWKTLEVISFGTLSKLFCNFTDTSLKKQVAREFGLPQYTYLESWIRCVAVLRNYCAHHARIWNRRFPLKPQMPRRLPNPWITSSTKPQKLYHQLCILLYLEQKVSTNCDLLKRLKALFASFTCIDFHAMGFPEGWEREPLWR